MLLFHLHNAKKGMRNIVSHALFIDKLPAGLEPATYALRMRCSTD